MAKSTNSISALEQAMADKKNRSIANSPANFPGYSAPPTPPTFDLGMVKNAFSKIAQGLLGAVTKQNYIPNPRPAPLPSFEERMAEKGWVQGSDGVFRMGGQSAPMPTPATGRPVKTAAEFENLIRQGYQKLGGASPELLAQIPIMAKQIQQNPYLYPTYPAIPFAETSLGKNVTYPGNQFNWGVTMKPYPLEGYSPEYITERVGYRLSTAPQYEQFRQNPNIDTLQQSGYAPVGSNPHWYKNMQAAVQAFPSLEDNY